MTKQAVVWLLVLDTWLNPGGVYQPGILLKPPAVVRIDGRLLFISSLQTQGKIIS